MCEQPSKEVSLFGPTCTCTNTTALLLIPDILSLHNRKLSLHILCITAQYFMPCHPGQLSLVIPLCVGEMSTNFGWEGNRRSGVALATRHKQ